MKRVGWIFVLVLVFALGACSDSSGNGGVVDAAVDAAPACGLLGTFKSYDLDMDAGGAQVDVLIFKDNGFFEIDYFAGGMVVGPYTISGTMVTLTDQIANSVDLMCDPTTDTWSFTFRDACRTIAFEPVGTVCFAHRAVLKPIDGWTLTRQ